MRGIGIKERVESIVWDEGHEAVHVRGDTASYRADLKCERRDIVDFGVGAQSQGQTQTGRRPERGTQ